MLTSFFSEDIRARKNILINTQQIIRYLAVDLGERTLRNYDNLNKAKEFIKEYFSLNGHEPAEEKYNVLGKSVANVIVDIKGFEQPDSIVIVGAHYDTVEDTPGADDNASAVASLLELYRLLSPHKFRKTVRFVAFTLEEPPFFSSEQMGSMFHASHCKKRKENIELMVCLEMMGYASKRCRQDFPIEDMKKRYPSNGDYLGVFSLPSYAEYVYLWKKIYNDHAKHKIFDFIGPASIPGMDLSDHSSFMKMGFPAIMLSDTGYYRNKNYHCNGDSFDTINFKFLTENIMNSFEALRTILNMGEILKN